MGIVIPGLDMSGGPPVGSIVTPGPSEPAPVGSVVEGTVPGEVLCELETPGDDGVPDDEGAGEVSSHPASANAAPPSRAAANTAPPSGLLIARMPQQYASG